MDTNTRKIKMVFCSMVDRKAAEAKEAPLMPLITRKNVSADSANPDQTAPTHFILLWKKRYWT